MSECPSCSECVDAAAEIGEDVTCPECGKVARPVFLELQEIRDEIEEHVTQAFCLGEVDNHEALAKTYHKLAKIVGYREEYVKEGV